MGAAMARRPSPIHGPGPRRAGGWLLGLLLALACGGGMDRVDELLAERKAAIAKGTLMIPSAGLTDGELAAMLADPRVPALADLSLHRNALTSASMTTITASPKLTGLKNLNVSMNPIGDAGIAVLAGSPVLDPVRTLSLASVGATVEGMRTLASSSHVARVAELDVGFQPVGDEGARALAGLGPRDKLLAQQAEIGGEGARALIAGSGAFSLKLEDNPIGQGGLVGLSRISPAIGVLDLASCGLGARDLEALAAAPAEGLRSLKLDYNRAGDAGLLALASAPWLGQLEFLSVMGAEASPQARNQLRQAWGQRGGLTLER